MDDEHVQHNFSKTCFMYTVYGWSFNNAKNNSFIVNSHIILIEQRPQCKRKIINPWDQATLGRRGNRDMHICHIRRMYLNTDSQNKSKSTVGHGWRIFVLVHLVRYFCVTCNFFYVFRETFIVLYGDTQEIFCLIQICRMINYWTAEPGYW